MTLIVGDIHGNYPKARAFLDYKKDEEHVFVGDYTDSYHASDDQIIQTTRMIFESDAIVLSGNHDNQYFKNSGIFTSCSGYRRETAMLYVNLMEMYKDRIKASYVVDDYFITHGGVTVEFGQNFQNIHEMNDWCNSEFEKFKNSPVIQTSYSMIFNVNSVRGGNDRISGIFWATFNRESFDKLFNIVCGHTHSLNERINRNENGTIHVCVDCPKFICYNTKTHEFEDFFPEKFKHKRKQLEVTY